MLLRSAGASCCRQPRRLSLRGCRNSSYGKREEEGAAMVEFAISADGTAMSQHDVFGDGQTQAGAAGFAGAGFVDAIKAFEETRQVLGGDSRAEILHIEFDAAASRAGAENDAAAGAAILHRIIDEIGKYLVDGFAKIGRASCRER